MAAGATPTTTQSTAAPAQAQAAAPAPKVLRAQPTPATDPRTGRPTGAAQPVAAVGTGRGNGQGDPAASTPADPSIPQIAATDPRTGRPLGYNRPMTGAEIQAALNRKAPSSAEQLQAEQEATQNRLVQAARTKYDPGNADTLAQQQQLKDATVASARQQADDQLGAGITQHRIQMAESGGLGGTGDEAGRGNLLAQYYNALGNAEARGRAAVSTDELNRANELGTIESRIHGQSITDASGLYRDAAAYANAATNKALLNNTVGTVAPTLANAYASNSIANAYKG